MGTDNKRNARQAKDIERQKAKREPYDRVLIVCEDSKSSPSYFVAIRDDLRLSTVNIQIRGSGGKKEHKFTSDPESVVQYANEQKSEYDKVYCIIDRDQHATFNEALQSAQKNGINTIISIPCFEYWILLHFKYTDKPYAVCDDVISALEAHIGDYKKDGVYFKENYTSLKEKQLLAIKHAKQRESACQHEKLEQRNPYTQLHHLIECLKYLKDEKQYKEKCSGLQKIRD